MKESTISRKIDPEALWFQKDSLQSIDTTKKGIDLAKHYELNYQCDQTLYWFDQKKEHLSDCLAWSKAWSFHDSTSIEPLICVLEMCSKLKNDSTGSYFYNRLLKTFYPNNWSTGQKQRINNAVSSLELNDNQYEGAWDGESFVWGASCTIDTLTKIHFCSKVLVNTGRRLDEYKLVNGDSTYLEISINTRDCRCKDCSFSSRILIGFYENTCPEVINLNAQNTFWRSGNNWRLDPVTPIIFGKLFRNKHGLYMILAYKNNPKDELYLLQTYWIAPENLVGL